MIIKLKPAYKSFLWGGQKLKDEYNKTYEGDLLAESWELSCHPDGESIVTSGYFAGKTLQEFLHLHPKAVGMRGEPFSQFPILIKFIDAKNNLSVQVHPTSEYAALYEGEEAKDEWWYIVQAEENAKIYYGVSEALSKEDYMQHIENNSLTNVLKKIDVKKGDCFYIPAGTVHAICAGVLIAEVQQSSNTTYRVYDYARRDKNNNLRPLHIEKALEVTHLKPTVNQAQSNAFELIKCSHFTVQDVYVEKEAVFVADAESFHSLLILEGEGEVCWQKETLPILKGDSIFISAQTGSYTVKGEMHILKTSLGEK